jgi:hypothetical protein
MHNVHVNQLPSAAASSRKARWMPTMAQSPAEIPVRATQSDRVELAEVFAQIGRLPVEQRKC